jgi:mevalonate pyrophosphate decarboxylase
MHEPIENLTTPMLETWQQAVMERATMIWTKTSNTYKPWISLETNNIDERRTLIDEEETTQ